MKKTAWWAIGLVLVCTAFTSVAQIFYKLGVDKAGLGGISTAAVWPIFLGLALYGFGAVLLLIALKHGELSVLYPVIALGYVWVNILAAQFFDEPINALKWGGIVFIMLGVSLIGRGSD